MNKEETKPWGSYKILSESDKYKIKEVLVKPNHRLSYQYHHKRSENWIIITGTAKVILNDQELILNPTQKVFIPQGTKHRVQNIGKEDLVFIEVQTGSYFGEDDIVRIEDDYSR